MRGSSRRDATAIARNQAVRRAMESGDTRAAARHIATTAELDHNLRRHGLVQRRHEDPRDAAASGVAVYAAALSGSRLRQDAPRPRERGSRDALRP